MTRVCPYCKTPLADDMQFCPGCGRKLLSVRTEERKAPEKPKSQKSTTSSGTKTLNIILTVTMVIQLAAMKNIDQSYYEAAEIDGASKWKQFTSITLPLIKPILKVDAVLIITGALKYYDLVAVMTGGGPNHATELMSTYMFYQGFRTLKYGYSSAIGVVLLLLCVCSVALSNLVFKEEKIDY